VAAVQKIFSKGQLNATQDEIEVSVANLKKVELVIEINPISSGVSAFGREFLRTVSN
jgi:hypothetical protein